MDLKPRARDWNLRSCGARGHVTFRPDEEALAARLHVTTPAGEAWRCLRCDLYVPGAPQLSGPADTAPIVLRGKALKDAFILRLLAVERLIRGLILSGIAYGIYRFEGARNSLQHWFDTYLPLFKPIADRMHVDVQETSPIHLIQKAMHFGHDTLIWAAVGVAAYAGLQFLEGIGLWLLKRWGEYVAVVGTSAFIPWELYEVAHHISLIKVLALLVNLAAVAYLVWSKRLFGVRGGHAAFEAERHSVAVLEVEKAALSAPTDRRT